MHVRRVHRRREHVRADSAQARLRGPRASDVLPPACPIQVGSFFSWAGWFLPRGRSARPISLQRRSSSARLTNLSIGARSTAMVSLEIRRHAEPGSEEGSGRGLSAPGIAAARGLRRTAGEFALVISSPRERARETAIEIAGQVDETSEFLAGSPDKALTQQQYDTMRSLQDVLELIGGNEHALRFAQQQLATWESIARRLRDGTNALVITHGGNIVLPAALLARRLGTDVAPLPLSYLEGVRVEYSQGRWCGLERLAANSHSAIVQTEVPLGGNFSQAVRVGDTVRRRAGPWTPAVQLLLVHLEAVGFTAAPRSLGFDERGRTVLAYLPGDIHGGWPEPVPAWLLENITTLKGAAERIRPYHDGVLTFRPPPDATWHQVAPRRH